MSAPGPMMREDETDDVYDLSSSSPSSDAELRLLEELEKRGSPSGSPRDDGYLPKKQKLDDVRLIGWRNEENDLNSHSDAIRDLNIEHAENSARLIGWRNEENDLNSRSDAMRDLNIEHAENSARLIGWRNEENDLNSHSDAMRDLNIEHAENSARLIGWRNEENDLNSHSDAIRDLNNGHAENSARLIGWRNEKNDLNSHSDAMRDLNIEHAENSARLIGWRNEENDLNSHSDAMRDLNIEHAENSASPIALPFYPQPSVEEQPSTEESGRAHTSCKQFWKAGDYEGQPAADVKPSVGIDHCRIHPKFLHANATSHKWALGAIAELVDNAVDEIANGATFVNVDIRPHPKNRSPMLVVQDDGGGMSPSTMRQCMSFGYSAKSKNASTIGQYGNGFKTSTMRLGADVIVFSRSPASNGHPATQSVGMLSFTFLRENGHDDVIVPMVDFEFTKDHVWKTMRSASETRWAISMETIQAWSPYSSEEDLFDQFASMEDHGTKIVLYNLWEDDQGQLELDFETDPYDIQIRGANCDEKKITMVRRFPHSRHCLTYPHSLRSYVSILYLRMPSGFKIILRGEEVRHHTLVDDMMYREEHTYRPQSGPDHVTKASDMVANVVLGFVKDAKDHINIQGFNVYHKNRLIKPFWKIWNSTSSDGRGIIGVLEANFVQPSHDKQGLESTSVLSRLEARLLQMQKAYWTNHCYKVGYSSKKHNFSPLPRERVPNRGRGRSTMASPISDPHAELRLSQPSNPLSEGRRGRGVSRTHGEGASGRLRLGLEHAAGTSRNGALTNGTSVATHTVENGGPSRKALEDLGRMYVRRAAGSEVSYPPHVQQHASSSNGHRTSVELDVLKQLKDVNNQIRERCRILEEGSDQSLMFEIDRNRKLEAQLLDLQHRYAAFRLNIESCVRERDTLQTELEEERLQRKRDDEATRNQVRLVQLQVQELEAESLRLQFARC